tara:strand:+ start:2719 stop:3639 length:921 start_codon:yes stop_codon:yes gene_type:complete
MQTTNSILLIKPAQFGYNSETAISNVFQKNIEDKQENTVQVAIAEFDAMVEKLKNSGIDVTVINDTNFPIKPDAVFPNNWVSFHADGTVVLYPMLAKNRRLERRQDILDALAENYEIKHIIDLSDHEQKGVILEGTGSIIFDRIHKNAFACISPRTDKHLFEKVSKLLGYAPISFHSVDENNSDIYHTNVMMTIGNDFAVVCLESITNAIERQQLMDVLENTGHTIVDINYQQMNAFCGNMLELERPNQKNILTMSNSAFDALTLAQRKALEEFCTLFPINIPTIENIGGGSVRCMIAENFLPQRS